ncbi:MAG: BatA domain-containing protein [Bacteroidota bacterium]
MNFVYPGFLFALAAISIPILIHLFHFRRYKKVFFSNTAFLQQITDETEKQSKIKHLLVLLARIFVIASLVFAFARPYIPVDDSLISHEGNVVSIYIDNSFSMEDESISGNMLDLAKDKAREIISAYSFSDEFILLTNDFEGKHQRLVGHDEFVTMLNEVEISPAVKTINEVSLRQHELIQSSEFSNQTAYIISDFQKNISDFENISTADSIRSLLVPLQSNFVENLYIDSVWTDSPLRLYNQQVELIVRIQNTSESAFENQAIRLFINNAQRGVANFDIDAESGVNVRLPFTVNSRDYITGHVEITDYPITFDDTFYFNFKVTSDINILCLNREKPNKFINALFRNDTLFNLRQMQVSAVDYSAFTNQGLIILNGVDEISSGLSAELSRFVKGGGNLIVFPSENIDYDSFSGFSSFLNISQYSGIDTSQTKVTSINEQHFVYKNVFDKIPENIDLPVADKHYIITKYRDSNADNLMLFQNGDPFLSSYPVENGLVFLSAVGLNDSFSNFQRHSIFVPTLYNIALQSDRGLPLYHIIGHEKPIIIRQQSVSADEILKIQGENFEVIPQSRIVNNTRNLYTYGQIPEAGNFSLNIQEKLLDYLSFNYDRRESQTFFLSLADIKKSISDNQLDNFSVVDISDISIDRYVTQMQSGKQLWALFLILALFFLLTEVLLLRFLK